MCGTPVMADADGCVLRCVIAYDDERQLSEYGIDWTTIVDKWIHRKLKLVYETLDWDLERLTARRVTRKLW